SRSSRLPRYIQEHALPLRVRGEHWKKWHELPRNDSAVISNPCKSPKFNRPEPPRVLVWPEALLPLLIQLGARQRLPLALALFGCRSQAPIPSTLFKRSAASPLTTSISTWCLRASSGKASRRVTFRRLLPQIEHVGSADRSIQPH